jgi:hypothetical protein
VRRFRCLAQSTRFGAIRLVRPSLRENIRGGCVIPKKIDRGRWQLLWQQPGSSPDAAFFVTVFSK